jgi:hypothetical protein
MSPDVSHLVDAHGMIYRVVAEIHGAHPGLRAGRERRLQSLEPMCSAVATMIRSSQTSG